MDKSKIIRDAATVILLRDMGGVPHVLMGQRGAKAAFMPNKYVFPGGAVDAVDYSGVPEGVPDVRLGEKAVGLYVAALRELLEETGLTAAAQHGRATLCVSGDHAAGAASAF